MLKTVPKTKTKTSPVVSFSTLAKLMGPVTPVKWGALLRDHKYPSDGPKRSYQNAQLQMIAHAVSQTPFNPHSKLRSWEMEVIQAMMSLGVPVPVGATSSRPSTRAPHWSFHGVDVSVFPDLELDGPSGRGAFKAYFGKEKLARGVGSTMAALLHHYLTSVLGQQNVNPQHCIVYEVRQGARFQCGTGGKLLSNAQSACQLIAALWPTL